MMGKKILKIITISLITFITKSFLEIILQWLLFSIGAREHVWGKFSLSLYYIWFDFVLHFWIYILVCVLFYLTSAYLEKTKNWTLFVLSFFIVTMIFLYNDRFQFPMKQHYMPERLLFNYKLVVESIVYTLSLFLMILLIRNNDKSNLKN